MEPAAGCSTTVCVHSHFLILFVGQVRPLNFTSSCFEYEGKLHFSHLYLPQFYPVTWWFNFISSRSSAFVYYSPSRNLLRRERGWHCKGPASGRRPLSCRWSCLCGRQTIWAGPTFRRGC